MRVASVGLPPDRSDHQIESLLKGNLEPASDALDARLECDLPRSRSRPGDPTLTPFNQAQGEVRRAEFCGARNLLGNRIAVQHTWFTFWMANGVITRKIEDQTVVGLNLLITADARENHLGPAAETGEIVMAHGANGDQTSTLDGARVETAGESCPQITDAHQTRITAVVLDDPDRPGQWTNKGCDGLPSDRRMGSVCNQDGDRTHHRFRLVAGGRSRPEAPPRGSPSSSHPAR